LLYWNPSIIGRPEIDNLTSSGFKVRNQIKYIDTPELEELEDIFNEYFVTQIKT
jgi:hypothetical protein